MRKWTWTMAVMWGIWLLTFCGVLPLNASEHNGPPEILARIDLRAVLGRKPRVLPIVTAHVSDDPLFHGEAVYRGYPLTDVLGLMAGYTDADRSQTQVRFVCADGYVATVTHDQVRMAHGVIAFEDLAAPEGDVWRTFRRGRQEVSPAPFYLVWPDGSQGDHLPWAYQLIRIELVARDADAAAFPHHAPEARGGYEIFKQKCMHCHGMNLVGGRLGPELNVPKNITEYWPAKHLRAFIHSAASYQAGVAMPSFAYLTEAQLDQLLAYLTAMKQAKICDSAASCAEH